MFKRSLIILAASGLIIGVSSPASADNDFGFDPYYVENPNGKEVAQTNAGVGDAFGFDPYQVAGTYEPQRDTQVASGSESSESSGEIGQLGHWSEDPAFANQVSA
jgi:hypothetical protein